MGRGSLAAAGAVALVLFASVAGAEGAGEEGLPALVRVPLASSFEPGWALSAASGYGYHDAVLGAADSHHRVSGSLFAALPLWPWLALAAGVEGRYDRHLDVPGGTDDGWISQPVLAVSAVHAQAPAGVGARARVWLPGQGSFDPVAAAASADLNAFARFRVAPVTLAASAGFRLDRSAASVERPEALSGADRMALGVSDSDAVLLGAGLAAKLGGLEVVGEGTWDVLVGERAPPLSESPLRLAAGLVGAASSTIEWRVVAEVSPNARPSLVAGEPLVPVDPRLTVLAGVRVRLGAPGPRTRARVASPEPPPPGSVAGRVRSETGAAVPGARVVVDGPVRLEAPSRGDGRFELGGVPPGRYQLTARAQGYRALERSVTVDPGRRLELTLVVARDVPPGELRGYVQSFDGTPLAATLTIIETESEIQAGVDGRFGVALAPGSYTVRVSAPGYRDQVMMVTIDEGGVTIRNIDLERSPDR